MSDENLTFNLMQNSSVLLIIKGYKEIMGEFKICFLEFTEIIKKQKQKTSLGNRNEISFYLQL